MNKYRFNSQTNKWEFYFNYFQKGWIPSYEVAGYDYDDGLAILLTNPNNEIVLWNTQEKID